MSHLSKIRPAPAGSPGPKATKMPQGITIQLTKVQSEDNWEDLDESELIFTLDQDDSEDVEAAPKTERTLNSTRLPFTCNPGDVVNELALAAYECAGDVLLANDIQRNSSPMLPSSPTSKPAVNLVKSHSSEIDSKEASPHKPHPLVNLVKSISTEISRLEPEVSQSKSDSKLNVHLWRQITQPKGKNGDSRTAPSSPSMSPSESKGLFFNVQEVEAKLEDTKRRLSEAMQEPLSMLSKIIGEEASPNLKCRTALFPQESPTTQARDQGLFDFKDDMPEEGDCLDFAESMGNPANKNPPGDYCKYKICSYGDVIQVVELASGDAPEEQDVGPTRDRRNVPNPHSDVPYSVLICAAILAYNFLIWPLPAYISGLFVGLASGFLLGFFIILLIVPRPAYDSRLRPSLKENVKTPLSAPGAQEPDVLRGWMNEISSYDPETYHPAFTNSVFVTLEGTTLKRSYPKCNLPRRSIFGEEIPEVVFVAHQTNDLTDAQVFLYPHGLARKRLWNKKYPICIQLCDMEELSATNTQPDETEATNREAPKLKAENPEKLPEHPTPGTLYLFGRTGREKEEWYQQLARACRGVASTKQSASKCDKIGLVPSTTSSPCSLAGPSNSSGGSSEDIPCLTRPKELTGNVKQKILLDYGAYMSRLMLPEQASPLLSPCQSAASSPTLRKQHLVERTLCNNPDVCWINAFIGRILWDFLREKYWEDMVADKIQKKLTKIKLPHFMNELTLTGLDMGTSLPQINSISNPTMNERGLWMDLDVSYSGFLQVTLETKMNLSRLGKEEERGHTDVRRDRVLTPRARIFVDSDEESSSAGSSEDEEIPITEMPGALGDRLNPTNSEGFTGGNSTGRRILRFVDKITKSRYFQKATENEYIKRKIEEVSNTPLLLTVELQELEGTLTVNIPPPPTDRIWYSFQTPPRLEMRVRPKLGEREVTFIHVTEWIEKKLQDEFQKILVMPNMDDLYFPVMQSGVEGTKSTQPEPVNPPVL
ncbi:testis expressed 2, gene 1 [Xenopus tropicalis]|uniref:Testis expressed 2, gene 1 n=2 Tax=Xenopus tropicalis TaxID=8364 RepID=F6WP91_XENTR|nr:testis expressed 2, gene 1 [Xenopus tropicalis]|eukprot:NP_001188257.1 testis expressed 2, gene 1 [Xenopus tropicalis]